MANELVRIVACLPVRAAGRRPEQPGRLCYPIDLNRAGINSFPWRAFGQARVELFHELGFVIACVISREESVETFILQELP